MTASDISPLADDLANLAEKMLSDDAGKHDQATIRRAISTAYYAAFHGLCELCADALVGRGKSVDAYLAIYRSLAHGLIRNALSQLKGLDDNLTLAFEKFQELRDARHWADYDPSPRRTGDSAGSIPPEKIKERVEDARNTVSTLRGLDEKKRLTLAAQLIAKARGKVR